MSLTLTSKKIDRIVFAILFSYPLVGMGIDLIAPSLPAISRDLHAASAFSKNLITLYLLGYALGSFILGFLSDTFGRRKLIVGGFLLFIIASLLPILWITPSSFLLARFLQGFSIAGFSVVGRAVLSDILPPERAGRTIVSVAILWGLGPVIGPVIGGYLQYYFNWPACFYFFAAYGLLGLLATIFLIPETHFNRQPLHIKQIFTNFKLIATHKFFIGMVILMGLSYSLLIVFNTIGPFLIQVSLGRSPIYFGHLALFMGVIYLLGSLSCRYLIKQFSPEKILFIGVHFFLFAVIVLMIFSYMNSKSIWLIGLSTALMYLACGLIYPSSMSKGLSFFRHLAGSSTAMMILINVLITALVSFIMSGIHVGNAVSLIAIYIVLMAASGLIYWTLIHPAQKTDV